MKPIVIAGGSYFETCEAPYWRALYGSGGRAAKALIGRGPIVLHTYFPQARAAELYPFVASGIDVRAADSPSALAFAYFHPLSDPVLAPARTEIPRQPSIEAEGNAVLRFGFVEGDAIVHGRRVVYDPQSVGEFDPFGRNGSSAGELAIVLNTHELQTAARQDDLNAAADVFLEAGAEVVVAKSGVQGAFVHARNQSPVWVPAFWSDSVFKIGTGDVFSAAFTYEWAHLGRPPVEAAHAASQIVSLYAAKPLLPLPSTLDEAQGQAVGGRTCGLVHLVGSSVRLADRWLYEEAAWRLQQLGARVSRLGDALESLAVDDTFLVLADQIDPTVMAALIRRVPVARIVVLSETEAPSVKGPFWTRDFTTALYWVCWISSTELRSMGEDRRPVRNAERRD